MFLVFLLITATKPSPWTPEQVFNIYRDLPTPQHQLLDLDKQLTSEGFTQVSSYLSQNFPNEPIIILLLSSIHQRYLDPKRDLPNMTSFVTDFGNILFERLAKREKTLIVCLEMTNWIGAFHLPTPQQLNSSTPQHLNSSTPQPLNSSTPQHLNSSTPQHLNPSASVVEEAIAFAVEMGIKGEIDKGIFGMVERIVNGSNSKGKKNLVVSIALVVSMMAVMVVWVSCRRIKRNEETMKGLVREQF